ncbi:hypothetical protein AB0D65_36875 [Streptomyces griseoloalbus]|uniref:Uncharacterized protein n=1 Tax=Streptomyces griseoloalbus TaxID=67303 RepID=A0ABV3EHE5_9ACTN
MDVPRTAGVRAAAKGKGRGHGHQRGRRGAGGRQPGRRAAAVAALAQVLRSVAGYLTVPGHREMFAAAGSGEAVDLARTGADTLMRALPAEAAATAGLIGGPVPSRPGRQACAAAGLDETALVPATAGDPGGEHTPTALAPR